MTIAQGFIIAMGALGLINGWLLFIATRMGVKLHDMQKEIADHREDALQNRLDQEKRFATKDELETKFDQIMARFDRLEERIVERK